VVILENGGRIGEVNPVLAKVRARFVLVPLKLHAVLYMYKCTQTAVLRLRHHPQREKAGWMAEFHKRHAGRPPWWAEKH
jgi:hypothetical protein